ncbi:hypothetical protein AVEN_31608-1 [Araneus ventricosus]|uniref:Uncharacterized protein n=1 Tax=Araneus ventricosus TaxID=182803 RepID=A0A4Y2X3F5_ARAVE|nr:hypothetical protein AVEN_31608-1 [Araneus ventricosus]
MCYARGEFTFPSILSGSRRFRQSMRRKACSICEVRKLKASEVQLSTPPDKRNPPVLCPDLGLLISQVTFLSTTCKKSHIYVSLVSTFPTKVNVIHRPSNPRFVTLN